MAALPKKILQSLTAFLVVVTLIAFGAVSTISAAQASTATQPQLYRPIPEGLSLNPQVALSRIKSVAAWNPQYAYWMYYETAAPSHSYVAQDYKASHYATKAPAGTTNSGLEPNGKIVPLKDENGSQFVTVFVVINVVTQKTISFMVRCGNPRLYIIPNVTPKPIPWKKFQKGTKLTVNRSVTKTVTKICASGQKITVNVHVTLRETVTGTTWGSVQGNLNESLQVKLVAQVSAAVKVRCSAMPKPKPRPMPKPKPPAKPKPIPVPIYITKFAEMPANNAKGYVYIPTPSGVFSYEVMVKGQKPWVLHYKGFPLEWIGAFKTGTYVYAKELPTKGSMKWKSLSNKTEWVKVGNNPFTFVFTDREILPPKPKPKPPTTTTTTIPVVTTITVTATASATASASAATSSSETVICSDGTTASASAAASASASASASSSVTVTDVTYDLAYQKAYQQALQAAQDQAFKAAYQLALSQATAAAAASASATATVECAPAPPPLKPVPPIVVFEETPAPFEAPYAGTSTQICADASGPTGDSLLVNFSSSDGSTSATFQPSASSPQRYCTTFTAPDVQQAETVTITVTVLDTTSNLPGQPQSFQWVIEPMPF